MNRPLAEAGSNLPPREVPSIDFGTATTTVPRRANSVRRTSHLDTLLTADGGLTIAGSARDLVTASESHGEPRMMGEASIDAFVDNTHALVKLDTHPKRNVNELIGLPAGPGFRAALDAQLAEEKAEKSALYLLVDEIPVMTLISGYASLYSPGGIEATSGGRVKADICSGWRSDGLMITSIDNHGEIPIPVGPPAMDLASPEDPCAWHAIGELGVLAMRRRRLIDIWFDGGWAFYGYFRDTYVPAEGVEMVLHEYELHGALDSTGAIVTSAVATPKVLPWGECPHAAGSARWIEGVRVDAIRSVVRERFRGTDTCTHLNDLVRSLGDLDALGRHVKSS